MTERELNFTISDFHCMSDAYLVDNLEREYKEKIKIFLL